VSVHIDADRISCDASVHAWRVSGPDAVTEQWQVTWMPCRVLSRNEAITAVMLAEHHYAMAHTEHAAVLAAWAGELNLTLDAVTAALTGRSTR
jgi:hypothetical protein